MDSIEGAWKFFINAAAGLGIAQILRWFWWRANAYTEISAMLTAIAITFLLTYLKPENASTHYDTYGLVIITLITLVVSIISTLLTKQVGEETLKSFAEKCLPIGLWKGIVPLNQSGPKFLRTVVMWLLGMLVSFSGLFAVGHLLFGRYILAISLAIVSMASLGLLFRMMQKENKFFE